MKSENKYIGDDNFQKMLGHYNCPTPLSVVKMKFAGAICSPNLELRPADVIGSFWEQGKAPRLETKNEADLFFKYFMGLWDDVFENVKKNNIKLSSQKIDNKDHLIDACYTRVMEIEFGFNEGFWGGRDDLKIPAFIAEMIDSLTELGNAYAQLSQIIEDAEDLKPLKDHFIYSDKMVAKALNFIIENYVLPRVDDLQRQMN